jgi:predicted Zn-dependent peptidase
MKPMVQAVLALSLLAAANAATASAAQPPVEELLMQTEPFPVARYTLPNGLRVWCQPRSDSESVAALLVIGAGARYETLSESGVSHFVEHMLFTGTERWSEEEIKEVITRRGGRWNGWTDFEQTTYFVHMAVADLDVALDWLDELVFHATFPADKVDKEREVIFQERWGHYGWLINTLDALGFGYELDRDVQRALFPGSSLGYRIVGEDTSLEHLDRAALWAYYRSHYTPGNAALIVVGNVTPEQILERATVYFGGLEPGRLPARPAPPPLPGSGPHQVVVRGPMPTARVQLVTGARTVAWSHPDRWALDVLAEVLAKDLTEEIRYKRGLVYGLGVYSVYFDDAGYFVISTTSERASRDEISQAIEKRLEQIRQGQVSVEAVAEAKAALKGRWALSMEDNVSRAQWLADWTFSLDGDEPVPDYPAAIEAVQPEDLPRVLAAYFAPELRYVGRHEPVVTVVSGARAVAAVAALGIGVWGGRRLLRRAKSRTRHNST